MTISQEHAALVRRGWEGAPPLPSEPLAEESWSLLVAETDRHRTVGYLAWAVADGDMPATEGQMANIFEKHASLMRHALVLEDEARKVLHLLRPQGVEPALLKGVAAAHLDHDDPSLRVFQDVDVLVRPRDIDLVVQELLATDCSRDLPPRSADWDRRFAKDIAMKSPRGAEIDVHRTLVPGAFGFSIDLDELHADRASIDLGGMAVPALGPERRALAAALALTVGEPEPRLAAGLDFVGTFRRHHPDVDELVRLSERWGVAALLAEGVRWIVSQVGSASLPTELHRWAGQRSPTAGERRLRRAYRSASGSNTATLLTAPAGMSSWRDRFDYLRWLIRPSAAYRQARDRSARPREWRTGLAELVGRRR